MKRISALLALLVAVACLSVAPSSAQPAALKKFTKVFTCGIADSDEPSGLLLEVGAGVYRDRKGNIVDPCGYRGVTWHPTNNGFRIKVRWFAGSKVVSAKALNVANRDDRPSFDLYRWGLREVGTSRTWRLNGKPVRAVITLSKKGFKTLTLTRTHFRTEY